MERFGEIVGEGNTGTDGWIEGGGFSVVGVLLMMVMVIHDDDGV